MPVKHAPWAPSRSRVRTPIHTRWAEVSYHWPEVRSIRVMASSRFRSRASWLVKNSTWCSAGWLSGVTPMASMNCRVSLIFSAISRYRAPWGLPSTKPSVQR